MSLSHFRNTHVGGLLGDYLGRGCDLGLWEGDQQRKASKEKLLTGRGIERGNTLPEHLASTHLTRSDTMLIYSFF